MYRTGKRIKTIWVNLHLQPRSPPAFWALNAWCFYFNSWGRVIYLAQIFGIDAVPSVVLLQINSSSPQWESHRGSVETRQSCSNDTMDWWSRHWKVKATIRYCIKLYNLRGQVGTETTDARLFAEKSSSSHRIGVHFYRNWVRPTGSEEATELRICASSNLIPGVEKWASMASVVGVQKHYKPTWTILTTQRCY